MKNKTLLKTLSTFLAVVMALCSAPLSGFVGIELPELFSMKAETYTEGKFNYYTDYYYENGVKKYYVYITGCADSTGDIVIPETLGGYPVTSIRYDAFRSTSITSITIPDSVTSIGSCAFLWCDSLARVYYTGNIESWCNISFGNSSANPMSYAKNFYIDNTLVKEIVIPDTITEIKNYVFCGFKGITSVTIPDSVTSIGNYAFSDCTSLTSVTIPDSVTSIGESAFDGCTSLTSMTIPDGVTRISDGTFRDCESLTSITIPGSVTHIVGTWVFSGCYRLTDVYYTGDIESWCNIIFSYDRANPMFYAKNFYINGELLENIVIPEGTTAIKANTFYNFNYVKTVTIPESVITIHKDAFYNCRNLKRVYYGGTDAQWDEIIIYEGNDALKTANKTFLNGGHAHVYDSSVTTEPTCTETGVKTYNCYCGNTYTEVIPATGHIWGKWIVTLEPTATKDGRKVRACTVCSEAVEEESIPKTGHGSLESVRIYDLTLEETSTEKISPIISSYGEISYFIAFASSDKTVVIVDAEGNVAALKPGTSTITCTVTAADGTEISDTCTVTVTEKVIEEPDTPNTPDEPETKLSVKVNDFTLDYKGTTKLNPEIKSSGRCTVEYVSSNESVVTIDKDGNITAIGEGTAEITVTVTDANGNIVEDTCKVTVAKAWWQWLIVIFLFGWIWY